MVSTTHQRRANATIFLASLIVIGFAGGITACKNIAAEPPPHIKLDSTLVIPNSTVSVPIYYPVQELEDMANEKLGDKVIEAKMPIKKGGDDSLFLSISKFQQIELEYNGIRGIEYKVPLQIDGFFRSKVLGIKINNKDAVRAKVIITMYSDLYLDDKWNLSPQTQLKDIKWIEEPKLNVAGIKVNLKPSIEKALEANKEKITSKLDETVKNLLKIRNSIEKVWVDIQKPMRINRKVVAVWLKNDVSDMDGRLLVRSKDTLMIEANLTATMRSVLDSASAINDAKPLPNLERKVPVDSGIHAYLLATIPFDVVNTVLKQVTDTMEIKFKDHRVKIKSAEIYGTPSGLAVGVSMRGDIHADVFLTGTLGFDSIERKLFMKDFTFDINSEQSLIGAADWLVHDEVIERLQPYLQVPLGNVFEMIPQVIMRGIEKGKIGKKINVNFSDLDVSIYQYLITNKNIQIIVSAKGYANVELQKDLFNKKKKPI